MRNIFRIAVSEFRKIFYSPVGWIILVVFIIHNSIIFFTLLQEYSHDQTAGFVMPELTDKIFAGNDGILPSILKTIYWYVPLITMGLISLEKNSGTIRLLQSSPLKYSQIVLGKYLATLFLGLLLCSFILLLTVLALVIIPGLDFGWVMSAVIGIYLLYAAYSAIGLFMSSLTRYQVVAAISTFTVFMALDYIGALWQNIAFVQGMTFFLHISGRANQFLDGLISSRNTIYFLLIITFFLLLTIWKLSGETRKFSWKNVLIKYMALVCGCFFVGWVSLNPYLAGYLDFTADQHMTIPKESQAILKQIKGPLIIHSYTNILDFNNDFGLPVSKNILEPFFERYVRFKPDIRFENTLYYDTTADVIELLKKPGQTIQKLAAEQASGSGLDFEKILPPTKIRATINLQPEGNRFVWQLQYGNRKSFLRCYNDIFKVPFDQEWANSLKQLTTVSPEIIFLNGNGERRVDDVSDNGYSTIAVEPGYRYALVSQGFQIKSENVDNLNYDGRTKLVVIADPKVPFTNRQLSKIGAYVKSGGNLMVCGESGRSGIVNPIIQDLGIQLSDTILYQTLQGVKSNLLTPLLTNEVNAIPPLKELKFQNLSFTFPVAAKMDVKGHVIPLLAIMDPDRFGKDSKHLMTPVIAGIMRDWQKIIVAGDADWLSNAELNNTNHASANLDLATAFFSWSANCRFPVKIIKEKEKDTHINLSSSALDCLLWLFALVIPGTLLVVAYVFQRKRSRI
ncbi:MAG TPA: Gldg family protein [Mucilaginibacter sp.]|nr:Gldg family protein [Mucilaginibacter sp.]